MNKTKALCVVLVIVVVTLIGLCCHFHRDTIRMNRLLDVATAIGGKYCYIGRDLKSEERLNRYVQFNSLAFDTYDNQKAYYQKVFEMDQEQWKYFSENYGNYQVHILRATVDNGSNDIIKDVMLHSVAPNVLIRNDIFYFKPVNIGPQSNFSNEIKVLVDTSSSNETEVLELLSNLPISFGTQTSYGVCSGRLMFCPDIEFMD